MRSTQPGWMSSVTIGDGLGSDYFLALAWVAGFAGIGMPVLRAALAAQA